MMILFKRVSASKILQKNCLDFATFTANTTFNACRSRTFISGGNNFSNKFCVNKAFVKYSTQATQDSADATENENYNRSEKLQFNTDALFEEIAAGDPVILKQLKLIEFEIAVLKEEEFDLPQVNKKKQWLELLTFKSPSQRKKYLQFLRLNEFKQISSEEKKMIGSEVRRKLKKEQGFHYYGLAGHSLFMRIYEKNLQKLLMQRHERAELEVVLDCSYQDYMTYMNTKLCAKQLSFCLYSSRRHRYPNRLKFCNFSQTDKLGALMPFYFQPFYEENYCTIHKESYLDLYPRERLVYLSPHATDDLVEVNSNDVLIIGAFVDRGTGEKISLAKAKENNIRMAKFPIDQYMYWQQGNKCLPVNVVLDIILNMAFYRDWKRAFKQLQTKNLT